MCPILSLGAKVLHPQMRRISILISICIFTTHAHIYMESSIERIPTEALPRRYPQRAVGML